MRKTNHLQISHPTCNTRPVHTIYMVRRRGPPNQGWRTFLRNHALDIAAMDLFVVPAFALTCCLHLSLPDWTAEILSGLTSRQTQRLNGSRDS